MELLIACEKNDLDIVSDIIGNKGAGICIKGIIGNTAFVHACAEGGRNYLTNALDKIENLDSNVTKNCNWTIFMFACFEDIVEIVRELREKDAKDAKNIIDYNIQYRGFSGLMFACRWNYIEIVKELLQIDTLDIYAKDNDGITALKYAYDYGHNDIIKMLKERIYRDISIIKMPMTLYGLLLIIYKIVYK
jgi:ankyrin repeat protein